MGQSCNFDIFNLELFGHRLAVSTISAISSVTAIILNSLVLYSIWKTASLHKPSYILIANLALTDLISGAIVQPLQIIFNVTVLMKWKNTFCSTWLGSIVVGYLMGSVSLYTMVLISVDRLLAIKLKNKYRSVVTLKRILSAIIIGWIGGGFAVPMTFFWSNISNSKLIIFAAAYKTLMLTILTVCYSMAYRSLKKLSSSVSSRTARNGTRDSNLQISSSISSSTTRNEATNSKQHQLSRTPRNKTTSSEQHRLSSSLSSSTARNKATNSEQQHRPSSSISSSTARNKTTSSEQHHRPSSISSSTARNKTSSEPNHRPSSSISSSTARNKTTSSKQNLLSSSLSSSTPRNKATNSEQQHRPSSSISSSTARNKTTSSEQHRLSSSLSSSTAQNKTSSEQNLLSSSLASSTARNKATNSKQHRLLSSVLNSAPEETATSNQRAFNVIKYRRSLNTMLLVLLCMLISYLPLVFVGILLAATMTDGLNFGEDSSSVLTYKFTIFSETIVLIASSVNPFLYIWRIKDLRQAVFLRFRKIFRRKLPDNQRQQERS